MKVLLISLENCVSNQLIPRIDFLGISRLSIVINCSIVLALIFFSIPATAQSEISFLKKYNHHIDPEKKLDSVIVYCVTIKSKIVGKSSIGDLDFSRINVDETRICEYYSNGEEKCINKENNTMLDLSLMPIHTSSSNGYIKYHVNIIPEKDFNSFKVKTVNDSILILEKVISQTQKHQFTFDVRTLNLLETENSNITISGENFISRTRFIKYQLVDGILVPQLINYSNSFCNAVLEYKDIIFK